MCMYVSIFAYIAAIADAPLTTPPQMWAKHSRSRTKATGGSVTFHSINTIMLVPTK